MFAAFERAKTLFKRETCGRAMRAVGVSRFVFPFALPHGGHIWKENRRGFEDTRLRGLKLRGGRIAVVNQLSRNVG